MGSKAQSAFEFLLIIAFMTLLFVSLFALANAKLADSKDEKTMRTAEDIADLVLSQVELASALSDGYSSQFIIPQTAEGASYSIEVIDGREIVVIFNEYEHVEFLPINVTGSVGFGQNTIAKREGRVYLNG